MSEDAQLLRKRELAREASRRWREANPDKARAASRRAYHKNPERSLAASRRWNAENPARVMLRNCRERSREKGLPEPTITVEWLEEHLALGRCAVTGLPFDTHPTTGTGDKRPFAASVDRIVPTAGYAPENCRLVVAIFNLARNTFSDSDVRLMASALCSRS